MEKLTGGGFMKMVIVTKNPQLRKAIEQKFPTIEREKITDHVDLFSAITEINVRPFKIVAVIDTELSDNYKVAMCSIRTAQPNVPIILYTRKISSRCKKDLNPILYELIISDDTMPLADENSIERLILKRQSAVDFIIGNT